MNTVTAPQETETKVDTTTLEEVIPYVEDNDPKRRTHIINPVKNLHLWEPGMTSQDVVDIARATNRHVVGLCGYRFYPKHNPEKYDACSTCFDIAASLLAQNKE